eukprot:TRINITY_DN10534_c0_g1_i1.p3 TRINITY_DN10534_c0_g1~~TRINITY_DN10534_c0_g1_i1.p3  ORF type:complete len:106 (+),score=5.29 TRINITY_DN10534_c0_g1_i1:668-985(+)
MHISIRTFRHYFFVHHKCVAQRGLPRVADFLNQGRKMSEGLSHIQKNKVAPTPASQGCLQTKPVLRPMRDESVILENHRYTFVNLNTVAFDYSDMMILKRYSLLC